MEIDHSLDSRWLLIIRIPLSSSGRVTKNSKLSRGLRRVGEWFEERVMEGSMRLHSPWRRTLDGRFHNYDMNVA
jgi:hypothetical protein